ncbi:hypothetical protein LSH36_166g02017 [Paralvinella palmiformis]|uniref:Uncharacterized protein n=1 Tax=Paralvinella palmiformis TaxID=53620 RepID=A0AAD9JSX6_9ANNE|nr:hypothetical protein LSH36_166g02017 [Paralvinella palmiformis]
MCCLVQTFILGLNATDKTPSAQRPTFIFGIIKVVCKSYEDIIKVGNRLPDVMTISMAAGRRNKT